MSLSIALIMIGSLPSLYANSVEHVVIVSIDGGKPAALKKSYMPHLNLITEEGSSTFKAETIFPSSTLPSHTSMLTGVSPRVHKITWNFWNPFRGPVEVPTIFSLAKAQRYSTALLATKEKFRHLEVRNSLNLFSLRSQTALEVAREAQSYLRSQKTRLTFIHMPDADKAGHSWGWESPQQIQALGNVDDALGIVLQTMREVFAGKSYVLIVTADHGGSGTDHGSASPEDKLIPWIIWGTGVKKNYTITRNVSTMDTAATALWLLGVPAPRYWEGTPVEEAF